MKPALVLGLALAANAMAADSNNNELFVAPTGKLAEFAKKHPTIMFDEVADDELAVALAPRSVFKSDEEYKKYVYGMRHSWDDAADDEFSIKLLSRDHFKTEEEYQKYYKRARFTLDDAADDELGLKIVHLPTAEHVAYDDELLAMKKPREESKMTESYKQLLKLKSQQADDEELFFAPGQRIGNLAGPYPTLNFDEVADDELVVMIAPRSRFSSDEEYEKYKIRMRKSWDDAADDELLFNPPQFLSQNPTDVYGRILRDSRGLPIQPVPARFDEVADDELGVKYVHLPIAETQAFDDDELAMWNPTPEQYQRLQNLGSIHARFDEVTDDELAVRNPSADQYQRIQSSKNLIYSKFDEVADDELAYLGHLLNERVTEKPSHGKNKERSQMKRKFRPIVDEAPLAQN